MNSSLGIYFGPKVISIVESKGRNFINETQMPQMAISTGELEEKISAEVKLIEIIALFKSELRKAKIEATEATLCLSGKDLIIRTFEMPALPREELQNAINFEAKKYIPFKVEDLISDFQIELNKKNRTNLVLFIGIKKDTLDRYISILNQLNIKISAIEYSGFSILRSLALTGSSDKGIIGVLGADLIGEDEANFTVLEDGFPLFSRDIALSGGPGDFLRAEEADKAVILEKLKTEARVSLDYYHRKFTTKKIQRLFLISNPDCRSDLEGIMSDIGLSSHFVDVSKSVKKQIPNYLSFIKAYSSSLSKVIKSRIKINVFAVKTKMKIPKQKSVQREVISLFEGFRVDYRIIALGVLLCLGTFISGIYRTQILRKELNSVIAKRAGVTTVNPRATYEQLMGEDSEYKGKLEVLENLVKKQLYLTEPLNVIPKAMPAGVWLKYFSFRKKDENKAELVLEGTVYLADSDKEFAAVNTILSILKANSDFTKYFKEINIVSLDRGQFEEATATNFLISCKMSQGKK